MLGHNCGGCICSNVQEVRVQNHDCSSLYLPAVHSNNILFKIKKQFLFSLVSFLLGLSTVTWGVCFGGRWASIVFKIPGHWINGTKKGQSKGKYNSLILFFPEKVLQSRLFFFKKRRLKIWRDIVDSWTLCATISITWSVWAIRAELRSKQMQV